MVGRKKQDFWPINILKGMTVRQKLGMISEKKVIQIFKLKKKKFNKKSNSSLGQKISK